MKKVILFIAAFSFCSAMFAQLSDDPVLMVVDGNKITKSEFEYIYNKNNSNNSLDKKNLDEYVRLFVDLKLKVAEAQEQGLDTTKAFKDEFNGYRNHSAKQYLTDHDVEERVLREAYNRLTEEVDVSHILIRMKSGSPEDTLAAYQKAMEVRERLRNEDFAAVASEESEDAGTAADGGKIGYITGFQTILPFENAAFSLRVGRISEPVRTMYGYHILKVNGRRPSQGSVHVAHIMKVIPPNTPDDAVAKIKASIDSVYDRLRAGEDFSELAKNTSDHMFTARKGGDLGWFETGRSGAGPDFEDTAFSLSVGEYSRPVRSLYGYHIIKLLDKKALESFDEKKADIQKALRNDERSKTAIKEFKKGLRKEYNLQIIQSSLSEIKNIAADSEVIDSAFLENASHLSNPLFSFSTIVFNQDEFITYLQKYKNRPLNIDDRLYDFIDDKLYEFEDTQLEEKHPEFKMLMQEYYDGMLMFEISSKEVWEKAAEDTVGLQAYFDANRKNYTWDTPRFRGTIVYCKDKKVEQKAKKIIKNAPADSIPSYLNKALNTGDEIVVKTETAQFIKGEHPAADKYAFGKGNYTPDKEFPIVFVAQGGVMLAEGPDNYRDMKGIVISDYQNYLQEEWIKKLRRKYPVTIYEHILKSVTIK